MLKRKKTEIIYSSKEDKPSRFLVNLPGLVERDDDEQVEHKKGFFSKLNRPRRRKSYLSRISFKKGAVKAVSNIKGLGQEAASAQEIIYSVPENTEPEERKPARLTKFTINHEEKIRRLAIFPFLRMFTVFSKSFGLLFSKLCFKLGWLAVFLFRFILLLAASGTRYFYKRTKNAVSICYRSVRFKPNRKKDGADSSPRFEAMPKKSDAAELFFHSWDSPSVDSSEVSEETVVSMPSGVRRFFQGLTFRSSGKNNSLDTPKDNNEPEAPKERTLVPEVSNLSFRESLRLAIKPALIFSCVLIVSILPIKGYSYYNNLNILRGEVLGISEEAVDTMVAAAESIKSLDFKQAEESFSYASKKFVEARQEINRVSSLLAILNTVPINKNIELAANAELFLEAGRLSAEIGNNLSALLYSLSAGDEPEVSKILENIDNYGRKAIDEAKKLSAVSAKIDPGCLPIEYRGKFIELRSRTETILGTLGEFINILDGVKVFLGYPMDSRYLVVFQNNTELRASGGFIGSYALVDFQNGKIKNLEIPAGGSYDTQAGLYDLIVAPEPLQLVNPRWHFWDANWWPDWPTTAKKLMWFYERSNGPSVDGVISLTPTVIEKLLKITGPIDMTEDYGVIINAENFWEVTQTFSEQKPKDHPDYRSNPYMASTSEEMGERPKKIIGDMMRLMIEDMGSILERDKIIKLIILFEENIRQKHVLMYFNDNDLQATADRLGWSGRVGDTKWDYLQVVNTNIAGGKSDREIDEAIFHRADISADGTIINTVTIKRVHKANKGDIFTGQRNNDWMRVYVPLGSELIEAVGFSHIDEDLFKEADEDWTIDPDIAAGEAKAIIDAISGTKIYDELGKTVFANWSQVDPGNTAVIRIKYKLPFKLKSSGERGFIDKAIEYLNPNRKELVPYSLMVQKQPGSIGSKFESILNLPEGFNPIWHYPENSDNPDVGWKIMSDLVVDRFWAVLAEVD